MLKIENQVLIKNNYILINPISKKAKDELLFFTNVYLKIINELLININISKSFRNELNILNDALNKSSKEEMFVINKNILIENISLLKEIINPKKIKNKKLDKKLKKQIVSKEIKTIFSFIIFYVENTLGE